MAVTFPGSRRGRQKPMIGTGLDPSNPLSTGLVLSVLFNEGGGNPANANLLGGGRSAVTGSIGWAAGQMGSARDLATLGGSNYESFTFAPAMNYGSGPWTAEIWATFRAFQATSPKISGLVFLSDGSAAAANRAEMRIGNSTLASNQPNWIGPNSVSLGIGPARLNVGQLYQVAMTFDGVTLRGYVNGQLDSSIACTATAGTLLNTVMLWRDDSGALGRGPNCLGECFRLWNRALPAGQMARLYADPFAMYLMPTTRRFFKPAAGVVSRPWGIGGDGPTLGWFEG